VSAGTELGVLHYPAERGRNWDLLRAAARDRGQRLVSWAPHLIGLWCADGEQYACYAGKPARPGIVIHRTVAPFRGIAIPFLSCLAAGGSLVLNPPDAAFRSRQAADHAGPARAGIPVVPTAAFDEPAVGTWSPGAGRPGGRFRPRRPGRGNPRLRLGRGARLGMAASRCASGRTGLPRRTGALPGAAADRRGRPRHPGVRGGGHLRGADAPGGAAGGDQGQPGPGGDRLAAPGRPPGREGRGAARCGRAGSTPGGWT
jgi:hypothetical protein